MRPSSCTQNSIWTPKGELFQNSPTQTAFAQQKVAHIIDVAMQSSAMFVWLFLPFATKRIGRYLAPTSLLTEDNTSTKSHSEAHFVSNNHKMDRRLQHLHPNLWYAHKRHVKNNHILIMLSEKRAKTWHGVAMGNEEWILWSLREPIVEHCDANSYRGQSLSRYKKQQLGLMLYTSNGWVTAVKCSYRNKHLITQTQI